MVLQLRTYQEEMVEYLVKMKRALCYDQPGMGKTIEAIEAAVRARQNDLAERLLDDPDAERRQILVVCPGYLCDQWVEAIKDQYPNDIVSGVEMRTPPALRVRALLRRADWVVINKEMLREYPVPVERFSVLILDEAHHFRNRDAKQSKGALEIAQEIPYVFELTATPVKKEADDLFMLFRILQPDKFTSYWQFVNTYLWASNNSGHGTKISGIRRPTALKNVLNIHGKGRTYKEVALQIPKLINKKHLVALTPEEQQIYTMIRVYWRSQEKTYNNYMSAMQALRQVTACEAKIEAAKSIIEDSDGVVVTFCWYQSTARKLARELGVKVITGNTPQAERVEIAKSGKHVVATIASLSEGVDLSHAHEVVFVEEDYTPGSRTQALARVRRWSEANEANPRPVICHYVMVQNSIDLVVHNAVEGRVDSIASIMETEFLESEDESTADKEKEVAAV